MEQNNSNGQTMKPNSEYVKCAAGFGLGNKNDMAVLGYLITQTFTAVYRENKCIAIPLYKLSSCTGVARSTIWDSVIRLESRGCIEVERPKVMMKGSATTYRVCHWVMDKVAERKDGKAAKIVKRNDNMDQDNELKRQIQSLQAENARLQARLDNAIKWWNATNGKMKALEAENAELKKAKAPEESDKDKRIAELEAENAELLNKFKEANDGWFNERNKTGRLEEKIYKQKAEIDRLKRYEDVFKRLVRDGVIDQKGNPVGGGMVTVEPEEPYKVMKVDEFMQELSSIKNKN